MTSFFLLLLALEGARTNATHPIKVVLGHDALGQVAISESSHGALSEDSQRRLAEEDQLIRSSIRRATCQAETSGK